MLPRGARGAGTAIAKAVELTQDYLHTAQGEADTLPGAAAMIEAGEQISHAALAMTVALSGTPPVSLAPSAAGSAAGSRNVSPAGLRAGAAGASALAPSEAHTGSSPIGVRTAAAAPTAAAAAKAAADGFKRPLPDLSRVLDRWGATVQAMQGEQQRLVAAAEDMEQHALDLSGFTLDVSQPVESVMRRFVGLVEPKKGEPKRSASAAELSKACEVFEKAQSTLLSRATEGLNLPEVFARMHGSLQQHKDSLNAWCYPLLNKD